MQVNGRVWKPRRRWEEYRHEPFAGDTANMLRFDKEDLHELRYQQGILQF